MNNPTSYVAFVISQSLEVISVFLPRLAAAFVVFALGVLLAKLARKVLIKILSAANFSIFLKKTPIQLAFEGQDIGAHIERLVVGVVYWLLLLMTVHASAAILEITSVTLVIEKVLNYLPQVLSAFIVLSFGLLLAGLVESVVKAASRGIGIHNSILLGKIASYSVVTIAALSSLSELGIAKEFVTILFVGFVSSAALASALAIGLGSKELVQKVLGEWHDKNFSKPTEVVDSPTTAKKK